MQKKKLDSRIPTLINNSVYQNHRSFFVIVGDAGREQVVTLHYLLSKARVSARPSVLWCYKKELGFSSHRKKRMNQIKKQIARGIRDADEDDPFELFISSTSIRYTYYKVNGRKIFIFRKLKKFWVKPLACVYCRYRMHSFMARILKH